MVLQATLAMSTAATGGGGGGGGPHYARAPHYGMPAAAAAASAGFPAGDDTEGRLAVLGRFRAAAAAQRKVRPPHMTPTAPPKCPRGGCALLSERRQRGLRTAVRGNERNRSGDVVRATIRGAVPVCRAGEFPALAGSLRRAARLVAVSAP